MKTYIYIISFLAVLSWFVITADAREKQSVQLAEKNVAVGYEKLLKDIYLAVGEITERCEK